MTKYVMKILERIAYYEKRHKNVEATCLNLEHKYELNDETANGFLAAIRMQEHWVGTNFKEIAKELLKNNSGKVCRYIVLRSVDCTEEMRESEFDVYLYSTRELEEIARHANSCTILNKIFVLIKNDPEVENRIIAAKMAMNPVADSKLLEKLYEYDHSVVHQIFLNEGRKASTEFIMKIFHKLSRIDQSFHFDHLMQFGRDEIYEDLLNGMCTDTKYLCEFLQYAYHTDIVNEKFIRAAEEKLLEAADYSHLKEWEIRPIISSTHNTKLVKRISEEFCFK